MTDPRETLRDEVRNGIDIRVEIEDGDVISGPAQQYDEWQHRDEAGRSVHVLSEYTWVVFHNRQTDELTCYRERYDPETKTAITVERHSVASIEVEN